MEGEEKYLQRLEQLLFEEGDFFVSAQKLFILLKEEIQDDSFHFENFILLLNENPEKFQVMDIPMQNSDVQELAVEIYDHGTFGGPFVSAAHKEFTEDEYADFMKLYVDSMIFSLEHMYQVKLSQEGPSGDGVQKIEGLLQRAYELKYKLDEIKL